MAEASEKIAVRIPSREGVQSGEIKGRDEGAETRLCNRTDGKLSGDRTGEGTAETQRARDVEERISGPVSDRKDGVPDAFLATHGEVKGAGVGIAQKSGGRKRGEEASDKVFVGIVCVERDAFNSTEIIGDCKIYRD